MSLNKVILIGYVGKVPEVRYLSEKAFSKVARFSLATSEWRKDASGKVLEYTEWHNIATWNASADYVETNIQKGMMLYVEGKLHYSSWTDKKGNSTTVCEIFATQIQVLQRPAATSTDESSETAARTNAGGNNTERNNNGTKDVETKNVKTKDIEQDKEEDKVSLPEEIEMVSGDGLPF